MTWLGRLFTRRKEKAPEVEVAAQLRDSHFAEWGKVKAEAQRVNGKARQDHASADQQRVLDDYARADRQRTARRHP